MTNETMTTAPIILVPGYWLGAWAWDEVASDLRADGHDVTALTLPGLESAHADRSAVTFEDHVRAICDAIESAQAPAVLVVHSGAGYSGYAASDRCPDKIAAMVYVDTGAGVGSMEEDFEGVEKPLPSPKELAENENLDGLSEEQLRMFRERAVPEPANVVRQSVELTNDARLDIPSTVICTGFNADQYREAVNEGYGFLVGLRDLHDVTYVDLPTSHWPMWSRPHDLARIIGQVARVATRSPAAV
jgi:pimeloyl-ACP methyl ester carboxylesterase